MKKKSVALVCIILIIIAVFAIMTSCKGGTLTVSFDSKGGTPVDSITVKEGDAVTLPNPPTRDGFVFDGWYVDESYSSVYENGDAVNADITLYAKWTPVSAAQVDSYSISIVQNDGATVEVNNGLTSIQKNQSFTFTIAAKVGYDLSSAIVKVNGNVVTAVDGVYTVSNVTANVSITVEGIPKIKYQMSLPTGIGYIVTASEGSISPVEHGGSFTFEVNVDEGYSAATAIVKANGIVLTAINGSYTVNNITENVKVTVEGIVKLTYAVTYPISGEGFKVIPTDTELNYGAIAHGTVVGFKVTVDETLHDASTLSFKVDGTEISAQNGVFGFSVTKASTITVTVSEYSDNCHINFSTEAVGYSIGNLSGTVVRPGTQVEFSVDMLEGYDKSEVVVRKENGMTAENLMKNPANGKYELFVNSDVTLGIYGVHLNTYSVSADYGDEKQYLFACNPVSEVVVYGGEAVIRIIPFKGVDTSELKVKCGNTVLSPKGDGVSYAINNVTSDVTFIVSGLKYKKFTVSLEYTDEYEISIINSVNLTEKVDYGTEINLKVSPRNVLQEGSVTKGFFIVNGRLAYCNPEDNELLIEVTEDCVIGYTGYNNIRIPVQFDNNDLSLLQGIGELNYSDEAGLDSYSFTFKPNHFTLKNDFFKVNGTNVVSDNVICSDGVYKISLNPSAYFEDGPKFNDGLTITANFENLEVETNYGIFLLKNDYNLDIVFANGAYSGLFNVGDAYSFRVIENERYGLDYVAYSLITQANPETETENVGDGTVSVDTSELSGIYFLTVYGKEKEYELTINNVENADFTRYGNQSKFNYSDDGYVTVLFDTSVDYGLAKFFNPYTASLDKEYKCYLMGESGTIYPVEGDVLCELLLDEKTQKNYYKWSVNFRTPAENVTLVMELKKIEVEIIFEIGTSYGAGFRPVPIDAKTIDGKYYVEKNGQFQFYMDCDPILNDYFSTASTKSNFSLYDSNGSVVPQTDYEITSEKINGKFVYDFKNINLSNSELTFRLKYNVNIPRDLCTLSYAGDIEEGYTLSFSYNAFEYTGDYNYSESITAVEGVWTVYRYAPLKVTIALADGYYASNEISINVGNNSYAFVRDYYQDSLVTEFIVTENSSISVTGITQVQPKKSISYQNGNGVTFNALNPVEFDIESTHIEIEFEVQVGRTALICVSNLCGKILSVFEVNDSSQKIILPSRSCDVKVYTMATDAKTKAPSFLTEKHNGITVSVLPALENGYWTLGETYVVTIAIDGGNKVNTSGDYGIQFCVGDVVTLQKTISSDSESFSMKDNVLTLSMNAVLSDNVYLFGNFEYEISVDVYGQYSGSPEEYDGKIKVGTYRGTSLRSYGNLLEKDNSTYLDFDTYDYYIDEEMTELITANDSLKEGVTKLYRVRAKGEFFVTLHPLGGSLIIHNQNNAMALAEMNIVNPTKIKISKSEYMSIEAEFIDAANNHYSAIYFNTSPDFSGKRYSKNGINYIGKDVDLYPEYVMEISHNEIFGENAIFFDDEGNYLALNKEKEMKLYTKTCKSTLRLYRSDDGKYYYQADDLLGNRELQELKYENGTLALDNSFKGIWVFKQVNNAVSYTIKYQLYNVRTQNTIEYTEYKITQLGTTYAALPDSVATNFGDISLLWYCEKENKVIKPIINKDAAIENGQVFYAYSLESGGRFEITYKLPDFQGLAEYKISQSYLRSDKFIMNELKTTVQSISKYYIERGFEFVGFSLEQNEEPIDLSVLDVFALPESSDFYGIIRPIQAADALSESIIGAWMMESNSFVAELVIREDGNAMMAFFMPESMANYGASYCPNNENAKTSTSMFISKINFKINQIGENQYGFDLYDEAYVGEIRDDGSLECFIDGMRFVFSKISKLSEDFSYEGCYFTYGVDSNECAIVSVDEYGVAFGTYQYEGNFITCYIGRFVSDGIGGYKMLYLNGKDELSQNEIDNSPIGLTDNHGIVYRFGEFHFLYGAEIGLYNPLIKVELPEIGSYYSYSIKDVADIATKNEYEIMSIDNSGNVSTYIDVCGLLSPLYASGNNNVGNTSYILHNFYDNTYVLYEISKGIYLVSDSVSGEITQILFNRILYKSAPGISKDVY